MIVDPASFIMGAAFAGAVFSAIYQQYLNTAMLFVAVVILVIGKI